MLRTRPTYKKPQSTPKKIKASDKQNIENTKPVSFNTKGYFSPDQPFNEEYLKVKRQVFKKYRDQDQQLVVIDKKSIHPGAFIQRGIVNPNSKMANVPPLGLHNPNHQRVFSTFIKNYMNRKEKKQKIDDRKYSQAAGGQLSQIRALQPSVRVLQPSNKDFQSCRTSRASKSVMHSRQSTVRSIFSYQELE